MWFSFFYLYLLSFYWLLTIGRGWSTLCWLWGLIYICKHFWWWSAKEGLPLHRIWSLLERICYFVHFLLSLVFGRKDKLAKTFCVLIFAETCVNQYIMYGHPVWVRMLASFGLTLGAEVSYTLALWHSQLAGSPMPQRGGHKGVVMGCKYHSHVPLTVFLLVAKEQVWVVFISVVNPISLW